MPRNKRDNPLMMFAIEKAIERILRKKTGIRPEIDLDYIDIQEIRNGKISITFEASVQVSKEDVEKVLK